MSRTRKLLLSVVAIIALAGVALAFLLVGRATAPTASSPAPTPTPTPTAATTTSAPPPTATAAPSADTEPHGTGKCAAVSGRAPIAACGSYLEFAVPALSNWYGSTLSSDAAAANVSQHNLDLLKQSYRGQALEAVTKLADSLPHNNRSVAIRHLVEVTGASAASEGTVTLTTRQSWSAQASSNVIIVADDTVINLTLAQSPNSTWSVTKADRP